MHCQFYTLADLKLRFLSDEPLDITAESLPFVTDDPGAVDLTIRIRRVGSLPPLPEGGIRDNGRCLLGNTVFHCNGQNKPPYAMVTYLPSRDIQIDYLPQQGVDLTKTAGLISTLGLETLLLGFDALILHSSFISWEGTGILFSAPSGTGKSTQAGLWQKHAGADILNGDRACIRRTAEGWRAYGMPYAGSSDIFRNESVPLGAIVILRQAPENRIRRVGPREAFGSLMPEFSIHRWDAEFMNRALDLVSELLGRIPVYLLECLPDADAVRVLQTKLREEVKQ